MSDLYSIKDVDLVKQLKERNKEALKLLFERYWSNLYLHALRMTKCEDTSKDIVQDLYVYLWENIDELQIHTVLSSYLYASVRYRVLNILRRDKTNTEYIKHQLQTMAYHSNEVEDVFIENELKDLIEREIELLPPKMKVVFKLSREEYLSYKEISEKLSISENTVRKQISNALKILRLKLNSFLFHLLLSGFLCVL